MAEANSDAGSPATTIARLLAAAPRNWGRWGPDDEVGALNYLTPAEVLRGVSHIRSGTVFTLQRLIGDPDGADDRIEALARGGTRYDALGHVWYDGRTWNGYPVRTTVGGLEKASVAPIGERGVVGRGVLLDIARFLGKNHLDNGETFDHTALEACAAAQGHTIEPRDILLVRTNFLAPSPEQAGRCRGGLVVEPGLTYRPELVS